MEEQELLDCLTEDVSLGMELVIRQYGSAVKTICRSILSGYSKEDIEETVSDTFVGLWQAVSCRRSRMHCLYGRCYCICSLWPG